MRTKAIATAFALITAASTVALADGTPQDHHCKLADGTFDGTKTKKQCATAKGTWAKDAAYAGTVTTGVVAAGGQTTGITLTAADGTVYQLDVHGDAALTKSTADLNGKAAAVTGYLTTKKPVEGGKDLQIITVSTLAPKK